VRTSWPSRIRRSRVRPWLEHIELDYSSRSQSLQRHVDRGLCRLPEIEYGAQVRTVSSKKRPLKESASITFITPRRRHGKCAVPGGAGRQGGDQCSRPPHQDRASSERQSTFGFVNRRPTLRIESSSPTLMPFHKPPATKRRKVLHPQADGRSWEPGIRSRCQIWAKKSGPAFRFNARITDVSMTSRTTVARLTETSTSPRRFYLYTENEGRERVISGYVKPLLRTWSSTTQRRTETWRFGQKMYEGP